MDPVYLEALLIPLSSGASLRLEDEAQRASSSAAAFTLELANGVRGVPSGRSIRADKPNQRPPFSYDATAPDRGLSALWLFELRDYSWQIVGGGGGQPVPAVDSSLAQSVDRDLWRPADRHGRFSFANFLGTAWISVDGKTATQFEVASPKLDYEREYRWMVEGIGEECQQLLLDWGSPTTLNIESDPERQAQTLLEQFLFLRHVLGPEQLDLFLEVIGRSPHTKLETESLWKPAGPAHPQGYVRDPLLYGREWRRIDGNVRPGEIREIRKYDSLDTAPNRFIKFALEQFRDLCDRVANATKGGGKPYWQPNSPVLLEAQSLATALDRFLALQLFDDVGALARIPLESTVLQGREGYREILRAWLLLDAAAQIDWPGRGEVYKGTSRNVALLYEYWLYFVLARMFRDELGMVPERDPLASVDGAMPACCSGTDGRMVVNLAQEKTSFCRFRWQENGAELRVHFFYNRTFGGRKAVTVRGSYSRPFRPDFSLVIIPVEFDRGDWSQAERDAEQAGQIAYLHFDAKYRGENLPGLFGAEEVPEDDVDDERAKAVGTVKNPDLYKMHTYNEAIRRTIGSYVLYPGVAPEPEAANATFLRYHEVVPGIGAFALRPREGGGAPLGLPFLTDFVRRVMQHQLSRFTQSHRFTYWTEATVREPVAEYGARTTDFTWTKKPPKDTQVLLGFVRTGAEAEICRKTETFFCHGVEWADRGAMKAGPPTDLQFDPFRSDLLTVYNAGTAASWIAEVTDVRLVTAAERAEETGRPLDAMNAAYYYRFQLAGVQTVRCRNVMAIVRRRPSRPVAVLLSEVAACEAVA